MHKEGDDTKRPLLAELPAAAQNALSRYTGLQRAGKPRAAANLMVDLLNPNRPDGDDDIRKAVNDLDAARQRLEADHLAGMPAAGNRALTAYFAADAARQNAFAAREYAGKIRRACMAKGRHAHSNDIAAMLDTCAKLDAVAAALEATAAGFDLIVCEWAS